MQDSDELLAEAKRRYPEGTKIKCVNNNSHHPDDAIISHSKFAYMNPQGIHHGNAWVVLHGVWADIIIEEATPFTVGGYVRTLVNGDTRYGGNHNQFKKGEIYQIKSIDSDGLINYNQPGVRLYTKPYANYPIECEWIGMNPHGTLSQEEGLVEVINNFPIY
jgi:hypothetical protein